MAGMYKCDGIIYCYIKVCVAIHVCKEIGKTNLFLSWLPWIHVILQTQLDTQMKKLLPDEKGEEYLK